MNVKDAAHIHGVSLPTVYRWIKERRLAAVKRGGVLHVHPLQVERVAERARRDRYRPRVVDFLRDRE